MATDISEKRSKRPVADSARAKKGLSMFGILRYTPPYVKALAREQIVVKKLSKVWTKGGMRAIKAVAVNMTLRAPRPHTVTIIGLDAKSNPTTKLRKSQIPKINEQKRVQVSCDCEDFCFTWEVALWSWGAAKIIYSNGEHPIVKNPGLVPGCCKHVVAVLREIKTHEL